MTHVSAFLTDWNSGANPQPQQARRLMSGFRPSPGITVIEEYGHGFNAIYLPETWEQTIVDRPLERWRKFHEIRGAEGNVTKLGRINMNLFPNLFVATSGSNLTLRLPKGPGATELWQFCFYDKAMTDDVRKLQRHRSEHHFGPAGIMEQDDGENWDQSTAGAKGAAISRYPLNYSMGVGRGEIIDDEQGGPRIETHTNEHAQLWTYRAWSEFMAAESWADLKVNHSRPVGRV
jgi:hypothetical protein